MIFEVEAKKSCDNCVFCSEGVYCNLRDGDHIKFKEKDYICTFEVEESFCPLISPIPITKKVRVIKYPETYTKDIPKKVVQCKTARYGMSYDYYDWACPTCNRILYYGSDIYSMKEFERCIYCGQFVQKPQKELE